MVSDQVDTDQADAIVPTEPTADDTLAPIHAQSLTFNDHTRVTLAPGQVVVLVGANNVGKSSALRDISAQLRSNPRAGHLVVSRVRVAQAAGHPAPLVEWVKKRFPRFRTGPNEPWVYGTSQATVRESELERSDNLDPKIVRQIQRVVTFVANVQDRLELTKPSQPIDRRSSAPSTPIQALYNDTSKVEQLSDACNDAFGHAITYSHHDGRWRLRLGQPRIEVKVESRHMFPTLESTAAIDELPVVEEQGDGLRSYLGVLLELLAERHLFIILDEPEAFLHPPQAHRLAAAIMETKQPHAQLFVATHDPNFVRGLLASPRTQLSIVRIERNGPENPVHVINPETISQISNDPILRHSNILDALFSTGAVVCEAEPDCHLYESTLRDNTLLPAGMTLHFVGSSGKERLHQTCQHLASLGVPTAAIVDFDLLKSPEGVLSLLQVLDDSPPDDDLVKRVESIAKQLSHLAKTKTPTKREFLDEINGLVGVSNPDEPVSATLAKRISQRAKESSSWSELKRYGIDATSGDLHGNLDALLSELASKRLHIVPVGELESWFRSATGDKGAYVASVLSQTMHTDSSANRRITKFVADLAESLKSKG